MDQGCLAVKATGNVGSRGGSGWSSGAAAVDESLEPPPLLPRLAAHQAPQAGFRQAGKSLIVIVEGQGLCLHFGVEAEQPEICRNGGSGGPAQPGEFRVGIDFAGVEEGFVMQSPPQRIAVTDYVQATRTALTTDLDVRGPFPNPLKDLELIPDAYRFSESGLWATNLRGAIMAPLSYVPQRLTSVTTLSTSLVFGPHLIAKTLQGYLQG